MLSSDRTLFRKNIAKISSGGVRMLPEWTFQLSCFGISSTDLITIAYIYHLVVPEPVEGLRLDCALPLYFHKQVSIMHVLEINELVNNSPTPVPAFETIKEYKAYTKFSFLISEAILIAQQLHKESSFELIKQEIIENDILQMRSKVSRKGAFRTLRELLEAVPESYIELLASGNTDIRRYTFLFLTLRVNRLLREAISELLIDKLQGLNQCIDYKTFQAFFELKREQEIVLSQWSNSTYQKVCSNTILVLVRSGLLIPSKEKKNYEIQALPLPFELKRQLLTDGLDSYMKLMLN